MRTVVEDSAERRRRSRLSRRHAARRQGVARMEGAGGRVKGSPYLRTGVLAAVAVLVLDQASKLWLLFVFDIGRRGVVPVAPFFDLVLALNPGISFGWFQDDSAAAQFTL